MAENTEHPSDFVRELVARDLHSNKHGGKVVTRFPPEPNGYLHIGHAKSIHLNFGLAREFGGVCHLRMDDTNPTTESLEYVSAIQRDVRWLGFAWGDKMFYASDYYPKLYAYAEKLITLGHAYVCHQTEEQMSTGRGSVVEPGTPSPWRDRSPDENLALFRKMARGEFAEGEAVLRAKIDLASPNLKMRDPNIYRIKKAHHYRQGDRWCVYPLYDFAHCLSDAIEGITHSVCTMEFENARELYDWVLRAAECDEGYPYLPEQTEFARLNLTYTVLSKRKLIELVEGGHVKGWDDPRLPTLAGLRRRGVTPDALRAFCHRIGVAKTLSTVEIALFEHHVREDLSPRSPRVLAVLKPLRVVIENWPAGEVETLDAPYWPHDIPRDGSRPVPFSGELFIDRDDFMEEPVKGFFRLAPGREVRLRHGYIVKCERVVKGADGEVTELRCSYDPSSRSAATGGRKVDGTIQWVSAAHALDAEVRLYDRLFAVEAPGADGRDFKLDLNPESLTVVRAKVEPSLATAKPDDRFQFERVGFFVVDADARDGAPVFNRTVSLKDAWTRAVTRAAADAPSAPAKAPKEPAKAPREPAKAVELDAASQAFKDAHGVTADEARLLTADEGLRTIFEAALAKGAKAKAAASLLSNEVIGELRARKLTAAPFGGDAVAELLALVEESVLASKGARDVLGELFAHGGSPRAIVEAKGWRQVTDTSAIEAAVDDVLAKNADAVGRFKAGNANVLGALVGMAIKATGGKGNPKLVTELVKKKLA